MSLRGLARVLIGYAIVLLVACIVMHAHASLRVLAPAEQSTVETRWADGHLLQRRVLEPGAPDTPFPIRPGSPAFTTVDEVIVAEGPLSLSPLTLSFALVPGRDGIRAELDGKTAWATADDLLAVQAYDHASTFLDPSLGFGTHQATVLALLSTQLGVPAADVQARAQARRVRFERRLPGAPVVPRITASTLERTAVMNAIHEAAMFIARGVDENGLFRYIVDAITDQTIGGYNWPRHAGTTHFLAQASSLSGDRDIRAACLRAAARLRDEMMHDCGPNRCIADGNEADVGSSALALIAFAEIARTDLDVSYRPAVGELASFLRAQQRPDGELMHLYDRAAKKPIDVQFLYYTGEAALALSKAHAITSDLHDQEAASRALARLAGSGWSFFGSRYYFSEEHWTCQATADLWERAPDREALAFCLRWHEYQRRLQHGVDESPFDAEGAFSFGPFITPRTTPAASRGEAAGAALAVMKRDPSAGNADPAEHAHTVALLDEELRRAIAFVLRAQLRPGPRHLFAHPEDVKGAMPGSAVDLQLRIDYVQHAGSMMIRWLEVTADPSLH
jgi:hypothetical protein